MKFIYQESTQTVRSIPQNYCVTAIRTFVEGGSTDAALGDLNKLGKLLAAAPEMYEALGYALDLIKNEIGYGEVTEKILHAMAKAKGE